MSSPLSIIDSPQPLQPFRMTDTLRGFLGVLSPHWLTFAFLVGVVRVPMLLLNVLGPQPRIHRGVNLLLWVRQHLLFSIATLLLELVLGKFSQAIISVEVFQYLQGNKVSIRQSVLISLANGVEILGIALLIPLGTGVGLVFVSLIAGLVPFGRIFLLVFVMFVLVITIVAVPACVIERLDPVESLSRSWELTWGTCWPILGVVLLFGIPHLLGRLLFGRGFYPVSATSQILSWLWTVAFGILEAVFAAVLYRDLRLSKEGTGAGQVAGEFQQ